MAEAPYNPLEKVHLVESIGNALEARPVHGLPPDPFTGAGIYAIYYSGEFELYEPISSEESVVPIYVGSALPEGGQTGAIGVATPTTRKLYERLAQHARSIEVVENLNVKDFRSRYLLVDDVWIPLAENYMISKYRPLWNSVVLRGFGIHAPGAGRAGQRRSLWDELHPGRPFARDRPPAEILLDQIKDNVRRYLAGEGEAETLPPESAPDVESEGPSK